MSTDFQNSFTGRLTGKFATKSYLNIPPHLNYVATLVKYLCSKNDVLQKKLKQTGRRTARTIYGR